jgi:hypothetical protein
VRAVAGIHSLAGSGRPPGSRVIAFATWLLALLSAGLMYVSFDAQYRFILTQKGDRGASLIEAAMLDAGMVILSALGVGLARAGKPSRSVRFLIVICAGASAGMNLAAANSASWRSDTVLRQHYSGYELRDCWPSHIHAIWELSTLAAAWHHTYGGQRPDLT